MTMKATFLLAVLAAVGLAPALTAHAQSATAAGHPAEFAVDYSYLHTNAPPGGCGCFSMNGFAVQGGFPVDHRFSLVADFTVEGKSNVLGTGTSLTLGSFAGGGRYRFSRGGWQPFGEVMAGGIQATGGYKRIGISPSGSATTTFVGVVGGGLDRRLSSHFGLRLFEADYFASTFDNGSNNHQNNLRITAGVLFRF
jgi:outer membrane immunogenic protein